jgi:agmatinase
MGLDAAANFAIERATDGTDCVWISFDIDCIDAGFVPGTGWPEPGGLLPRKPSIYSKKLFKMYPFVA